MRIFLAAHIVNCIISDPVPPPPRARAIQWKISAALSSHRRVHTKCTNIRIFSLMREMHQGADSFARSSRSLSVFGVGARARLLPAPAANLFAFAHFTCCFYSGPLDLSLVIPRHKSKCKRGQTHTQTSPSFLSGERAARVQRKHFPNEPLTTNQT